MKRVFQILGFEFSTYESKSSSPRLRTPLRCHVHDLRTTRAISEPWSVKSESDAISGHVTCHCRGRRPRTWVAEGNLQVGATWGQR
ncbi:hypothetical protein J6590_090588 [Homalodisca vitripennis]|nr:hypothetical protein J6590_090588 [Homalodisca vitripennis]